MSIEQQFDAAVKVIQSLPKDGFFQPSNEMRLRFYAFFKQATEGPNMTKKPAFYDIINRYKWDAWTKCGQMSKLEAMQLYVDELKKVIETVSMTHEVSEFLDLLGPFYEFLPNDITENGGTNGHANNEAKSTIDQKINDENMNENQIASTMMNHPETFTTYDSDGDEFADTIDLSPQHQQQQPQIFGINVNNNNQSSPLIIDQSLLSTTVSSIMNDNNNNNNQMIESSNLSFDMNEQLAVAIFQLQNSLNRINNRMDKLEQQVIRQQQQQQQQTSASAKKYGNNAWPMSELRPQTKIFILTWPFALFLILNYFQRLRKK